MNLDIVFKDKVSVSSKVRARHRFRAWLTIESTLWRGSRCRYTWEPSALTRYSCTSTGLHIGIILTNRGLITVEILQAQQLPADPWTQLGRPQPGSLYWRHSGTWRWRRGKKKSSVGYKIKSSPLFLRIIKRNKTSLQFPFRGKNQVF